MARRARSRRSNGRRPATRKKGPGRKIVGFGLVGVALAVGGAWGARWGFERVALHPALAVREVEVVGHERASTEEILALSGLSLGDPLLAVDRRAARFRIRSHDWIEDVRVRVVGPGHIRIEVSECVPLARVVVKGREYGICEDLRIVPRDTIGGAPLPVLRADLTNRALERGVAYVVAIRGCGLSGTESVELDIGDDADRIRLPDRGFSVSVDERIEPVRAVRNFSSFLETLDGEGASRGTLRLISDGTAVWKAA